jgi:prevent-host-death family protein
MQEGIIIDTRSLFGIIKSLEVTHMHIAKDIKSVTYLKSCAAELLKQINENHRPVIITQNGEARAVLQDPESYDRMLNAIGMLKLIAQGEENIKKGKLKTQEAVFANIDKMLSAK